MYIILVLFNTLFHHNVLLSESPVSLNPSLLPLSLSPLSINIQRLFHKWQALLNIPKWSFKKADWYNFKFNCSQEIKRNTFKTTKEKPLWTLYISATFHSGNNDTKILYSSKRTPQTLVEWRMRGSSETKKESFKPI